MICPNNLTLNSPKIPTSTHSGKKTIRQGLEPTAWNALFHALKKQRVLVLRCARKPGYCGRRKMVLGIHDSHHEIHTVDAFSGCYGVHIFTLLYVLNSVPGAGSYTPRFPAQHKAAAYSFVGRNPPKNLSKAASNFPGPGHYSAKPITSRAPAVTLGKRYPQHSTTFANTGNVGDVTFLPSSTCI